MNRQLPRLSLLLALLLLALPTWAAEREISETFDLGANGRISLSNINGDVTIEGWDRDVVEVRAEIRSKSRSSVERTAVDFDYEGTTLDIEVDLPRSRGGWLGSHDGATVEFWLKVPRRVRLDDLSLVNGSLEITGVEGEVAASLVNGGLEADGLRGDAELSTVNGSIDARFDSLGGTQRIEIDSVNGSIDLFLPADADAEISAETVHGRISNDFSLYVDKSGWVGQELRGQLGSGSARISLDNVNGSIDIRKN
ncbi:MAG: DUF4097 family beta strand repeat-containing protein [Thermoanaerobaculia bacterium]|nr:DUF4097 family beta strand repeat-containing protein [Thermoanaerobaculia bacterium]